MPSGKRKYLIGLDIGGTKMLTVLLDRKFQTRAVAKSRMKVQKGMKYFMNSLSESVAEVLQTAKIKLRDVAAMGVGCPGMIECPRGKVLLSPNISYLKNVSLRRELERRFHMPVWVENDVNAGLYGEFRFGAARGYKHVAGLFVGTGIGGALILNGKLFRGVSGGAGEVGHTFLALEPVILGSEKRGTLEALAARPAMAAEAAWLAARGAAPHLFEMVEANAALMKSKVLAKAIQQGDTAVRNVVQQKSRLLGVAMANIVNLLNPELIVLGGGVVEALGNLVVVEARESMLRHALKPLVKHVRVARASLGDFSVAKGAAGLAADMLEER